MAKDLHNEDWEKDAPLLSSLKGKQSFSAPEGYFESFSGRVMDAIREEENQPETTETAGGGRRFSAWVKFAAVIPLFLLVGTYFLLRGPDTAIETPDFNAQLASLSEEELVSAIEMEGMNDAELIAAVGDQALSSFSNSSQISEESMESWILDESDWDELDLESLDIDADELLNEINL